MCISNVWLIPVLAVALAAALTVASEQAARGDSTVMTDTQKTHITHMVSLENARNEGATATEKEEPVLPLDQKEPSSGSDIPEADTGVRGGAPRQEFVPSEKIPADQAVDFPADI